MRIASSSSGTLAAFNIKLYFQTIKRLYLVEFFLSHKFNGSSYLYITYQILLSQFHGTSITKDNNIRYYRTHQNLDNKHQIRVDRNLHFMAT